jgi:lipoprotein-anchoring transpeptidase ErfK/SrfK
MRWAKRKLGASVASTVVVALVVATASGCGGEATTTTTDTAAGQSPPALQPPEPQASTTGEAGTGADGSAATTKHQAAATGERTTPDPAAPAPADEAEAATVSGPPAIHLDVPEDAYALIWVRRGARLEVRTEPGGGTIADRVGRRTDFGSPTVYGVVKQVDGWAGVTTPDLPNGQLGWVRLDPRRLKAGWTKLSVVVDLSERRAALRVDGKVVRSFPVTIGAPGVETPTGRFAVTDTFRGELDPAAYGCCAVALSATQPHIPSGWLGGNRIAIHGTSGPLGVAASHGCVRAANGDVSMFVRRLPLGSPVFIHS